MAVHVVDLSSEQQSARGCMAHHEAGHLAAGWLLGLPVARGRGAVVLPGCAGCACLGPDAACRMSGQQRMEATVVAAYVGYFAELRAVEEGCVPLPQPPSEMPADPLQQELEQHLRERRFVLDRVEAAAQADRAGFGPSNRSDAELIAELLAETVSDVVERDAVDHRLWQEACELIASPTFWTATCAVADELDALGRVSGRRAVRLMRAALTRAEALGE